MEQLSQIYINVQLLRDQNNFNGLAAYFKRIENTGVDLPPYLLVLKARIIQLAEESADYTLEDVEESLLQAIQIEPDNLAAYIELGYFYYAVADQSDRSLSFFERAQEYAEKSLLSAMLGKAKALVDIGKSDEAVYFLNNSYFATHPDVKNFLSEIM